MTSARGLASLIASAALVASLTACSGPSPIPPSTAPTVTAQPSVTPTPMGAPSTTPRSTAAPTSEAPDPADPSDAPSSTAAPTAGAVKVPPKTKAEEKKAKSAKPKASAKKRWKPPARASWQWQLSGKLDLDVKADIYDVDLFDTSAAQVKQLHSKGRKVICYFSAGSYESGRPDSSKFPAAVKGKKMDGWPEYWLDIRDPRVLTLMAARMDLCAKKGFDGVEPDNVDGYQNDSGFPLTAKDQEKFNRALAKLAHDRGLAVGLKNDLDQVKTLQSAFDFAVNEECYDYDECEMLTPFIKAGKPVFHVEYEVPLSSFCPTTRALGFSSMLKTWDLDATRKPCPS